MPLDISQCVWSKNTQIQKRWIINREERIEINEMLTTVKERVHAKGITLHRMLSYLDEDIHSFFCNILFKVILFGYRKQP